MANELRMKFGSATTVISLAATLNNGANTYSGLTGLTLTEFDNANLWPYARAVLHIPDTFAAAPTAGSTIDLYYSENDIDGTDDETPVPAASDIIYLAKYAGSWVMDNQDVATRKAIVISLLGITKAHFHIINNSGQQISYSANPTTVKITPFTLEPTP